MQGIASTPGPAYHLDPEKAREYMKNIRRFRILVMGRANAGKTTLLQRVCNTVENPEIFDGKGNKVWGSSGNNIYIPDHVQVDSTDVQGTLRHGHHDIENELVFRSNPGFVFHDSCGFEAGSAEQFERMKNFVVECAAATSLKQHIHAIWFCIPMTDYHRTVTAAEQKFFNECDTGHVPVIVLLTKADALNLPAIEDLLDSGLEIDEAQEKAEEKERELLAKLLSHIKGMLAECKFPPSAYLAVQKMHEETADCTMVMQCTTNTLNEEGLQRLLISTQQSSITLCIEYAVQK
ncbi:GTP-binding protein [Pisolithus croceorrhizus]|nr:GTP-binding protein [Pisolithus croceorrhizus]